MEDLTVRLPRDVVDQARACGLLEPEALAAAIQEAIEKRADDAFFALRDAGGFGEPMSDDDILAEVKAVRAERRRRALAPA